MDGELRAGPPSHDNARNVPRPCDAVGSDSVNELIQRKAQLGSSLRQFGGEPANIKAGPLSASLGNEVQP